MTETKKAFYLIYVGGERRDRVNTETDKTNVFKTLSVMDRSHCYTRLFDGTRFIGQAEHVLPLLVAISYIPSIEDAISITEKLKAIGVTECTLVTCTDEECLNEIEYVDMALAI